MFTKRLFLSALTATALLGACHGNHMHHETAVNAAGEKTNLAVVNPFILPPLPGRDTALAGFEVHNSGETSDRLIAVSSPISGRVEIHTHLEEDGVMKMRQVKGGLDVLPGKSIALKRGGDHVMVFKTAIAEKTDTVPLTLTFENAGTVTVDAVVAHDGDAPAMDHSKMGH